MIHQALLSNSIKLVHSKKKVSYLILLLILLLLGVAASTGDLVIRHACSAVTGKSEFGRYV